MKTAEEILRKNVPTITFDKLIGTPIEQVIAAMEEYAEQQLKNCDLQNVSNNEALDSSSEGVAVCAHEFLPLKAIVKKCYKCNQLSILIL